jgi:hypothetical protein
MANVAAPRVTLPELHSLMHIAHGPLPRPKAPGKDPLRLKRRAVPRDDEFLASLTAAGLFRPILKKSMVDDILPCGANARICDLIGTPLGLKNNDLRRRLHF